LTPVFARKISYRAKWGACDGLDEGEIAADAVTLDLKTSGNELSFWSCSSGCESELRETVLALAANCERLDKMDVAWIDENAVAAEQLTVQKSPERANTPVDGLKERHVDISKLDLVRLGKVAALVRAAVSSDRCKRFAKKEVLHVIVEAIRIGRLNLEALHAKLREEVQAELRKLGNP
jgi:hypothetical protein